MESQKNFRGSRVTVVRGRLSEEQNEESDEMNNSIRSFLCKPRLWSLIRSKTKFANPVSFAVQSILFKLLIIRMDFCQSYFTIAWPSNSEFLVWDKMGLRSNSFFVLDLTRIIFVQQLFLFLNN